MNTLVVANISCVLGALFLLWALTADFSPADVKHRRALCDRSRKRGKLIWRMHRYAGSVHGPALSLAELGNIVSDEPFGPKWNFWHWAKKYQRDLIATQATAAWGTFPAL